MKLFNASKSLSRSPNRSAELAKVHHANVLKNLEHRMQVARAQGNQNLVHLLEQEQNQLA